MQSCETSIPGRKANDNAVTGAPVDRPQKLSPSPPLIDDPRQSYFVTSHADQATLRMAFREMKRHEMDGEGGESAVLRLHALLLAAGDGLFASSLLLEPPAVRRAVAHHMSIDAMGPNYPKTVALLQALKPNASR
jgi:hypothetical protein